MLGENLVRSKKDLEKAEDYFAEAAFSQYPRAYFNLGQFSHLR